MEWLSSRVFAAIDVGTNAVRLKLGRPRSNGTLQTLLKERAPVRPGDGVFRTGAIGHAAVDRLSFALADYASICRVHDAELRAVATSALRDASNRAEVLERIRRDTGITLEIISGREEARLTCLGVLEGVAPDVTSLCIDIGGGSTEIARARGEHPSRLFSLDMGGLRLVESYDPTGTFAWPVLEAMRARVRRLCSALPRTLALAEAIACSGTIRALIGFATAETRSYATRSEISLALERLIALGPHGRRRIFDPRRADVVVPGAVILEALMVHLDVVTVRAVKRGLRDGVLVDLARRHHGAVVAAPAFEIERIAC